MRTVIKTLAVLAVLGALGGAAVVVFGLYNVSARVGHLPGVSWVLHTTFRNAVALRAPPEKEVPELTEAMAALGAKHFDSACKMCHAAPGAPQSATIRAMVPVPPRIEEAVGHWEPAELHWIVDEGVKMSGMPYYPSVREDEVWHIVSFLTRVGEMDAATYAELTAHAPEPEAYCASCHGKGGRSDNPEIPRLDILSEDYVAMALETYRDGRRESGIMRHAISQFDAAQIAEFAAEFSGTAPVPAAPAGDDIVARGRALALAKNGDPDVPACDACHGPARAEAKAPGPRLDGQHRRYLEAQLKVWRDGLRGGGPRAELMRRAAHDLSDADIAALAAFYAAGGRGAQ
ncbi:c-type cytochrome [Roseivivax sp. CAU 1761]